MKEIKPVDTPVENIIIDDAIYPRIQTAWQVAYGYSQAMKSGAVFPPIVLGSYRNKLYLVDGAHRLEAFKTLKRPTIPAKIIPYTSKQAMFIAAVEFNNTFGKPLTFEDKAKIFGTLKGFNVVDADIEKLIHVPVDRFNTLASRVPQANIESRTKKVTTLPSVVSKAVKKEQISEADAYKIVNSTPRKDLMAQSALRSLTELITLFENNLVPMSDQKVQDQCVKLHNILDARLSKVEVAA